MRSTAATGREWMMRLAAAAVLVTVCAVRPLAACESGAAATSGAPFFAAEAFDLGIGTARVTLSAGSRPDGAPGAVTLAGVILPAAAPEAVRAELKALLNGWLGRPLRVEALGRVDRRGRRPADLRDPAGNWLQRELLAAGVLVLDGSGAPCPALLAAEAEARAARRGLWSGENIVLKAVGWEKSRVPDFVLLDGRISTVGKAGRTTYLNFGRIYRTDATGRVSEAVADEMRSAGVNIGELAGRHVLLRGFARSRDGLDLPVAGPAALLLLD